jgi:glycosyltransferase involved in cell wall biosynthesis
VTSVLITLDQLGRPVPGGIGTYVRELVRSVAAVDPAQRPEIVLAAGRRGSADLPTDGDGLRRRPLRLPVRLLTRLWDAGLASPAGAGISLVHATSLAVPPRSVSPLVVTVHDLCWRAFPDAFPARGRRWHEGALRRALDRADALVVPSDEVAKDLVAAGALDDRVEVIEHGCDHLPAPDEAAAQAFLSRAGVRGDYLLAVGTLEPRKNLARLMAGYSSIRADLPGDWPLVVVGQSGWGDAVKPVPGVVLGGRAGMGELAGLYARCRCMAYVPLGEGFGFPVVEAMSVGAPVVSSHVPAAGGASLEVDPFDETGIGSALLTAAVDGQPRDDLVAAGRVRAAALPWRSSADRHIALWDRLLSSPPAVGGD